MARNAVNPNVDSPAVEHTRRSEWSTVTDEQEREDVRSEGRGSSAALDETLSMREADSRREVPRLRTDAANPNKDRSLPSPSGVRAMLSSNMKKDLNKTKRGWVEDLPKTRLASLNRTMANRERLEGVNRALHGVVGQKSSLPPATRRRVEQIDRTIQDFERTNERGHVVYATLRAPKEHGNSRNALRRKLDAMAQDPNEPTMTFDSYIPASHSLGNVADGPDVVMEIRTRSGAYLGTSDTTPDANHLVGRGRVLRPLGVHQATYVKPDGSRGERYVVQMEDVTPEGRTAAQS